MSKIIIAYVPVVHRGYQELLERHPDADRFYILSTSFVEQFRDIQKDVRALAPEPHINTLQFLAQRVGSHMLVCVLRDIDMELAPWKADDCIVIMPDEEVSRAFAAEYLHGVAVQFESVFLRWDKPSATSPRDVVADSSIRATKLLKRLGEYAKQLAKQSPDWWRQVGGLIVKDGEVVFSASNTHVPSEHTPYIVGDPRGSFHKGDHIEMSSAVHLEIALIAMAARDGISLQDTDLVVTTFPCPWCAKAIALSGIRTVYYLDGYSMLDAQDILHAFGVKLIQIKTPDQT